MPGKNGEYLEAEVSPNSSFAPFAQAPLIFEKENEKKKKRLERCESIGKVHDAGVGEEPLRGAEPFSVKA